MSRCKNLCGKELAGRRKDFCSDKCRKAYSRKSDKLGRSNPDKSKVGQKSDTNLPPSIERIFNAGCEVGITSDIIENARNEPPDKIGELTAKQLYVAINSYPHDTWKDSPEYKELMKRLHSKTIEELESEGYSVPCWKYSEAA